MTQGVTIEQGTAIRMANATRKVENDGVDLRGAQNGHRPRTQADGSKSYFTPTLTATDKITIVDGFNIDDPYCGSVSVNKLALSLVAKTELTITADAFIYLECVADDDPITSSTNTIVQYASEQSWETGKEKILISRVLFDTSITDFSIEPVSTRLQIWGSC